MMHKHSIPSFHAPAAVALLFSAGLAHAQSEPSDWLNRMAAAVQSTSYEGTVIRIRNGESEALKVVHTIEDGVVHEKVVAQEGNGLEIIRIGNEVHCILPDRKSVLIEEWDDQSTLFSTLPKSEIRFGSEYDVAIVRNNRVAGRQAALIAIRPHDDYRYGHRLWLDVETGFPLQTQLIGPDGEAIEEVKFADIELNETIHASALAPSYSTDHFTWLRQPSRHNPRNIDSAWVCDDPPAGFRVVSIHEDVVDGSDGPVIHLMYSDGLATVSVFIGADNGDAVEGPAQLGGSNSWSVVRDGYEITAIGEVPAATVERISSGMRLP